MLEEELGLKVTQSAPLEREWDISIIINGKEIRYDIALRPWRRLVL